MTARRLGLAVALFVSALPALARAQSCPHLPAGARCPSLPDEAAARRQALQALDAQGRAQVAAGDLAAAARSFACLVEADPTPESAGNLAVVLREQGALGDALLVARCAEQLSTAGPARERARVRREEIERRLGLSPSPSLETPSAAAPSAASNLTAAGAAEPGRPRARRGWSYAALAVGAAALVGAGVAYAVARERAHQFADEERVGGYTDRARSLHDQAGTLQAWSFVSFGVGAAAALTGVVLLRF